MSFVPSPCPHWQGQQYGFDSSRGSTCTSTFYGHPLLPLRVPASQSLPTFETHRQTITARKGARRMPRQRSMSQSVPASTGAKALPEDGTPVFDIFVRTSRAKLWYPVCAIAGDERSKRLVNALKSSWGRAIYKNAIDKAMAKSLYESNKGKILKAVIQSYPHLKKYQASLQYGYKVLAKDLEEQPTVAITRDMALPFFPWLKKRVSEVIQGSKEKKREGA